MKESEIRNTRDLIRIEMALAALANIEPELSRVISIEDYEEVMIHLLTWHEKLCKTNSPI